MRNNIPWECVANGVAHGSTLRECVKLWTELACTSERTAASIYTPCDVWLTDWPKCLRVLNATQIAELAKHLPEVSG